MVSQVLLLQCNFFVDLKVTLILYSREIQQKLLEIDSKIEKNKPIKENKVTLVVKVKLLWLKREKIKKKKMSKNKEN